MKTMIEKRAYTKEVEYNRILHGELVGLRNIMKQFCYACNDAALDKTDEILNKNKHR